MKTGLTSTFMTLDNNGRLGIGVTAPSSLLELGGVANPQITLRTRPHRLQRQALSWYF
jgi:hypothetical protein